MNIIKKILNFIKEFFLFIGLIILVCFWLILFVILLVYDTLFGDWKKI
tara:strand:+ start:2722 stop:2865 length:144 start_codon:yes stop_codon:yes gene_type:complete